MAGSKISSFILLATKSQSYFSLTSFWPFSLSFWRRLLLLISLSTCSAILLGFLILQKYQHRANILEFHLEAPDQEIPPADQWPYFLSLIQVAPRREFLILHFLVKT